MRYSWFPWKWIVKKLARRHGFLDPVSLLAQMQRFAQPSEVGEPVELLRAGMIFHARGLMNVRAIQHNLDWIWPYWVQRQFDPSDESFLPRAFSFSHVNLTHRNWTAVGMPDCAVLPIVDPRGLVTPYYDGWSHDAWLVTEEGPLLVPARLMEVEQELKLDPTPRVVTRCIGPGCELVSETWLEWENGEPVCRTAVRATSAGRAWLCLGIRPYNPEGVNFIHDCARVEDRHGVIVNRKQRVLFDKAPQRLVFSRYHDGDAAAHLFDAAETEKIRCDVGMATACALFPLTADKPLETLVSVPLGQDQDFVKGDGYPNAPDGGWKAELQPVCRLRVPDGGISFLHDAAVRTMILHAPHDVYPGPYTYKRFWFRDAAFLIHGLCCLGLFRQAERALDRFHSRQTPLGYFLSQEGEWDSNGEALWIYRRFGELSGETAKADWVKAVRSGGHWIGRKRLSADGEDPHAGLLPAGFSAEHLGPNDFYFWDDFWAVGGLRAGAALLRDAGDGKTADAFLAEADDLLACVERAVAQSRPFKRRGSIPAAPGRRMDAGAVGSMVVDYPLRLWEPGEPRVLATARWLMEHSSFEGAFFQDMIHSGKNAYLTLHLAQVFLRAGERETAWKLVRTVAEMASPTGQWPEAVHPRTGGGCMGDGQHAWAAVEWLLMIRSLFLREEEGVLILASGIPDEWLRPGAVLEYGPAPTPHGPVTITIRVEERTARVSWHGRWRGGPPEIRVIRRDGGVLTAEKGADFLTLDLPPTGEAGKQP